VEHSIMKRAWPYAVALAIVVTGCYLALTPLLRSLSPSATRSSSSLTHVQTSATVGQSKLVTFPSPQTDKVASKFANELPSTVKKAKKKAATAPINTTPQAPTDTTGFASGSSSTQAPPKTVVKTKTKPVRKGGSVNGSVDPGNGGGLANPGGANDTQTGGTRSDPAGN
jgi:hypothetical protein